MFGESLGLLAKIAGRWASSRAAEAALAVVAGVCFLIALIVGSIAVQQALAPVIGRPLATAAIAAFYAVLGLIALLALSAKRKKRRRIGANLIATAPRTTPSMMLVALAAGTLLGLTRSSPRRRR